MFASFDWPSISLVLTLVIAKEISKSVCPFTLRLSVYPAAEFQARLPVYPCPPISQNPCIGAVFWTEKPRSVAVLWQGRECPGSSQVLQVWHVLPLSCGVLSLAFSVAISAARSLAWVPAPLASMLVSLEPLIPG